LGDKLGIFIFTNIHAPHIQKSLPLGGQLNKSQKYTVSGCIWDVVGYCINTLLEIYTDKSADERNMKIG